MNNDEVIQKLDKLADFQLDHDLLNFQKQELIDQVITPEIKEKINEINAEFVAKLEIVNENIAYLERDIKASVIEIGETVRGQYLMAVWARGWISWDTKALDGYTVAHPEISQFRKTGEPSVSVRKIV